MNEVVAYDFDDGGRVREVLIAPEPKKTGVMGWACLSCGEKN